MPNRVIREALLESDRWIELHDNTARVCFVALLLSADDVGNMEASAPRLRRLWREYGVDSDTKVAAVLQTLTDSDLARIYDADEKRHIHLPRFRQFMRHVKRRVPGSPWDDTERIQTVAEKTKRSSTSVDVREQFGSTAEASRSRPEVNRIESNRIESNRSETNRIESTRPETTLPTPRTPNPAEAIAAIAARHLSKT